jgi:Holliday junction resolvasome RuvABC endonuclease subunit
MTPVQPQRVLAVTPGTRHLGYAVLEGDELVRFGVKSFPGRKRCPTFLSGACAFLETLQRTYRPHVLAIELTFYAQARMSPLLNKLVDAVRRWARRRHLKPCPYLPTVVKERLCEGRPTRDHLAQSVVVRYPYLAPFYTRRRSASYWRQLFDAVGLGIVAGQDLAAARHPRHAPRTSAR